MTTPDPAEHDLRRLIVVLVKALAVNAEGVVSSRHCIDVARNALAQAAALGFHPEDRA